MQEEKGSDRSKSEFLTLGNEINGGIREIIGFDGFFMDEMRLEETKKRWKKGRGKRRGPPGYGVHSAPLIRRTNRRSIFNVISSAGNFMKNKIKPDFVFL